MKSNFLKQGYHSSLINEHLERISLLHGINHVTEKGTRQKSDKVSLVITYNRFLPDITKVIKKNWSILQIDEN